VHWLVDGYNVIRRAPELADREREGLEAGRRALCRLLSNAARASGDRFTVVFDGNREGGAGGGGAGVHVIFSSARETADRVLARMATAGAAVVSSDREVRQAAARAHAIAITADQFLSRVRGADRASDPDHAPDGAPDKDDEEVSRPPTKKGNPRRLSTKDRLAARALGRLRR
jgi:predicted RNA-binding protein with PIN domain